MNGNISFVLENHAHLHLYTIPIDAIMYPYYNCLVVCPGLGMVEFILMETLLLVEYYENEILNIIINEPTTITTLIYSLVYYSFYETVRKDQLKNRSTTESKEHNRFTQRRIL